MTRNYKLIIGLVLVLLLVDLGPILGQASKVFTGKISEIAKGMELDLNKHGTFYIVRLDEYPKLQFRLSQDDARRYGLIAKGGPASVLTPRMTKGIGWKVKLTCDPNYLGEPKAPTYRVTGMQKLGD
jgi:hypothetical protein